MTRGKCAYCGKIDELTYEFQRNGWMGATWNYSLQFCYECGQIIEEALKLGEEYGRELVPKRWWVEAKHELEKYEKKEKGTVVK